MRYKTLFFIITLFVFIGIIIWEFWPGLEIEHKFVYEELEETQSLTSECESLGEFWDGTWYLRYPASIEMHEQAQVVLLYQPSSNITNTFKSNQCELVVETYLDIPNHTISSGNQLVTPYFKLEPIQFSWIIEPSKEEIEGVLWVHVTASAEDKQDSHIPMFAVPIRIEKISIFSISPRVIRIGILFITILVSSLMFVKIRIRSR